MAIATGTTHNLLFEKVNQTTGSKSTLTVKNADPNVTTAKVGAFVDAYQTFYNSEQKLTSAFVEKREVQSIWPGV